jgi:hypothetical protein
MTICLLYVSSIIMCPSKINNYLPHLHPMGVPRSFVFPLTLFWCHFNLFQVDGSNGCVFGMDGIVTSITSHRAYYAIPHFNWYLLFFILLVQCAFVLNRTGVKKKRNSMANEIKVIIKHLYIIYITYI